MKVTYYFSFYGNSVDELMASSFFPDGGSHTGRLDNFDAAIHITEYYGILMQVYFIAPQTGAYIFRATSDDDSKVFLSTSSSEATKTMIVHVPTALVLSDFR